MRFLDFARARLQATIELIERLSQSEFPYEHSEAALALLETLFRQQLAKLKKLDDKVDPGIVKQKCVFALYNCFVYLPVLGFLLRSTNVRNAFETFWPLWRLAGRVLRNDTKLILSSEWDYSPLTYPSVPDLPGFVLIGLPAPESENPLLIPLAGHELGHSVWVARDLGHIFDPLVREGIIKSVKEDWKAFQAAFSDVPDDENSVTVDMAVVQAWEPAVPWALQQAEETFCDFLGIQVFGTSFLSAFAYLLSPNPNGDRCEYYPGMRRRVANMVRAANEYGVECPSDYIDLFEDDSTPSMVPADAFRLRAADNAVATVIDKLMEEAKAQIDKTELERPDPKEADRILDQLRKVAPAEGYSGPKKLDHDVRSRSW
jgi:hypothetical protein